MRSGSRVLNSTAVILQMAAAKQSAFNEWWGI